MSVVKLIKWIVILIVLGILVRYLGNLLLLLIGSYILFSMLFPVKKTIQKKLKIKSHALSSILSLLLPSLILFIVILYVFPVIITQLNSLVYLSYEEVFDNILKEFPFIENMSNHLGGKKYMLKSIQDTLNQLINIEIITKWSSVLLNNFSHIVINLLIVFFITFHLLRDEVFLNNTLKFLISNEYKNDVDDMLLHIKEILGRYFRGLLIDVFLVMLINSVILSILGVKNSVLIGILSGVLNIIPYVGPLITLIIGLFLGVSGNILDGHYELIGGTVIKIILTLVIVNLLDGTIFQPYIFSNVLQAHPLEVFLVIISAGMLGGIIWMMMAIPMYVIIKIVFKEIYIHWKNWT
ncbi:MAG: AI-2E family transporter [Bacteroidia bacterium]|nr:MAG: AI-2E family transporter [Bacteroidia bacterium]